MHTHTVRTKYTFGDRVRYSSPHNGSGTVTILFIDFDRDGTVAYVIQHDDNPYAQGGITDADITDADITPIKDDAESDTPTALFPPND